MQIGWVIAGGMTLGTLLTLFVLPCAYSIMGQKQAGLPSGESKADRHPAKQIAKAAE